MARRRETRQQVLRDLRAHLEQPPGTRFLPADWHHPADLADVLWLDLEPEEARRLFRELPERDAAEVLAEAERPLRQLVLDGVPPAELGRLLSHIPADDGADILELLPESERFEALKHLAPAEAKELRHLGEYDPDTAGGMMTTEFIACAKEELVGDLLRRLKRDQGEAETIYFVYVTDAEGILEGVASTRELLEAGIHEPVGEVMNPDVIRVRVGDDQEEVAHRLLHYNLNAIPVVDARGVLLGIVTADDALEVLENEGSEDALLLAGATRSAAVSAPLLERVLHRAPMLAVTVAAGLLMSRVMDHFVPGTGVLDGGASQLRVVLPYIPMVLGLAGNVGSQTSAVMVRGFAVGEIQPANRASIFWGEVQVGLLLGLLCCLLTVPAAYLFAGELWTALSMGTALLLAMAWSATLACSIAMGSQAAGLDPALVSGPVMMACSDLSATLLFFGSAHLLLRVA